MMNNTRSMHNKFCKLKDDIYNIILTSFLENNKCNYQDLLEEDVELSRLFSDEIVMSLINGVSQKELCNLLTNGKMLYDSFIIKFNSVSADIISKRLIILQPALKKYAKLAKIEKKKYSEEEVKRLHKINEKLEEYLKLSARND